MADALLAAARAAQAQAYCPYSGFAVGAALEAADGVIYAGCNLENAAFGLTLCAEQAAVAAAVTAGARRFHRLVVVSDAEPPATPCGACRQILREFGSELAIETIGPQSTQRWTLAQLLPAAFGPDALNR